MKGNAAPHRIGQYCPCASHEPSLRSQPSSPLTPNIILRLLLVLLRLLLLVTASFPVHLLIRLLIHFLIRLLSVNRMPPKIAVIAKFMNIRPITK
jgi:hypothetical protein